MNIKHLQDELTAEINNFCRLHLPDDVVKKERGRIIHDSTWKTNHFEPHEIEIIHTPLFQRLRHISQMGFVDYVFPSARHSRLEHSLGVTVLAGKMVDAVSQKEATRKLLDNNAKASIRMSALLHDVGHCLYSHTSEIFYGPYLEGYMSDMLGDEKAMPSPHEFLSYMIVTSESFREYFKKVKLAYGLSIDINEVAARIIGRIDSKDESCRYSTNFINGPLDADKLDYFYRDSQFSGIPIQLDLDRLLYELNISTITKDSDTARELTVSNAGVNCIEQIIFNKMILYSTIYTHHTVEAIDCMFRGVFEYINDKGIKLNINGAYRDLKTPADFLHLVDYNLFALADETKDEKLRGLINNIRYRRLLKRAFVINRKSIEKGNDAPIPTIEDLRKVLKECEDMGYGESEILDKIKSTLSPPSSIPWAGIIKLFQQKNSLKEKNQYLRDLAKKIWELSGKECLLQEIWIDIPKSPISKETQSIMVRHSHSAGDECENIDYYYPLIPYKNLYENNRLNGYVFAPEHCVENVAKAAKEVLEQELDIKFNDSAFVHMKYIA